MSGYTEISEWAFSNIEGDNYQSFLGELEYSFQINGRAPLNEIFDSNDYARLERDFNNHYSQEKLESLPQTESEDVRGPQDVEDEPMTELSSGFFSKLRRFFGL